MVSNKFFNLLGITLKNGSIFSNNKITFSLNGFTKIVRSIKIIVKIVKTIRTVSLFLMLLHFLIIYYVFSFCFDSDIVYILYYLY